jgi:hypothetical protein
MLDYILGTLQVRKLYDDEHWTIFFSSFSGPPVIESLEYGVNGHGLYIIKCTTSGTPPTKVTWTRNGVAIGYKDGTYKQTQILVNRTKTEYQNVLTVEGSFEDATGTYGCTVDNSLGISETVNKTIKCMNRLQFYCLGG